MSSNGIKIAIVGGGLAGLAAAMKIAEAGHEVDLISVVPVKRSHSVCAQGGINGAVNTKGEGDSPAKHLDDTSMAATWPISRRCAMLWHRRSFTSLTGWVRRSRVRRGPADFRRFGERFITGRHLQEPRPASNCSTLDEQSASLKSPERPVNTKAGRCFRSWTTIRSAAV